jgi:LacI family transcriptional regulator
MREKVKATAQHLGYRPDPLVAKLMAQLHGTRRWSDPHHIAWLDLWPKGRTPTFLDTRNEMLAGARERADELGFRIEIHRPVAEGWSAERLRQILVVRAQWGVIVPPVPDETHEYPLEMSGLAGVTIGFSLQRPALHRVSANHFQGTRLAFAQLCAKGFTRIGLVMSPDYNDRVGHLSFGSFVAAQSALPPARRLPPLLVEKDADPEIIARWLKQNRPDILLVAETHVPRWAPVARAVTAGRLRLVWLSLAPGHAGQWGIDFRSPQLGRSAVDLVVAQIHRNERGLPDSPTLVMVNGHWIE